MVILVKILFMKYFLHDGKLPIGPFELEELKSKKIMPSDLVWWENADGWKAASEVDGLKSLFSVIPPPIPIKSPPPIPSFNTPEISAGKKVSKSMIAVIVIAFVLIIGAFVYSKVAESMKSSNAQFEILQREKEMSEQKRLQDIQENAAAIAAMDARRKVVEQNISSHVSAYENRDANLFGKITSSILIVSNTSDYVINECVITVTSKSAGHEPIKWKENLNNIKPGASVSKALPIPSKGTTYELKISKLTNSSEGVYLTY